MTRTFDEVLDQCLTDLLSGKADVETLVARHPAEAPELRPLLEAALALRSDGVDPSPDPAWVEAGWRRLAEAIRERRNAPASLAGRVAALASWLLPRNWSGRARAAVVVGAVGLVGASGFAAAAGGVPDVAPFRFFASSNSSVTPVPEVEIEGVVVGVQDGMLTVDAHGVAVTVVVDARTEVKDLRNEDASAAAITPGARVKVEGMRQSDGSILAREVKLLAAPLAPTPTEPPRPPAAPAPAGLGGECDPSGPGNPCKDEDRSDPGPNAGPGNAKDRELDAVDDEDDDDGTALPTPTPDRDDDGDDRDDDRGSSNRRRSGSGSSDHEEAEDDSRDFGERDSSGDDESGRSEESRRDVERRKDDPDAS